METDILTTFGLDVAAVTEALRDFDRRFAHIRIEARDVFPEVHLQLSPREPAGKSFDETLGAAVEWCRQQLGVHFLSAQGKPMEAVVGELLNRLEASIAVAESCTGGLISHMLTNVSGSSEYFLMAAVTYSNSAKRQLLGVSEETLVSCGAVHEKTAAEMAVGIRRISGASFGLATTGIAGPTGGSTEKPVGTLCVGLAGPEKVDSRRVAFSFPDRLSNKKIFAVTALDLLRKDMLARITGPFRNGAPCAGKPGPAAT